jgi:hypothetical protein
MALFERKRCQDGSHGGRGIIVNIKKYRDNMVGMVEGGLVKIEIIEEKDKRGEG